MNFSAPFIKRPIATTLLTAALVLSGLSAFRVLPVSPLPQVDFPTVSVSASLPGASPEIMASSVATPLEREFGRISSVTEMTSQSTLGQVSITLQFDLNRNIDAATRDVESAINAARSYLPANLPSNPTYRKVNPADAPIMIIALTSDKLPPSALYDAASTILEQRLSQIAGVGQVVVGGSSAPAVRINVNPDAALRLRNRARQRAHGGRGANRQRGQGQLFGRRRTLVDRRQRSADEGGGLSRRSSSPTATASRCRLSQGRERSRIRCKRVRSMGLANGRRAALLIIFPAARRQHHHHGGRDQGGAAAAAREHRSHHRHEHRSRPNPDDSRLGGGHRADLAHLGRRWWCWSCSCSCGNIARP